MEYIVGQLFSHFRLIFASFMIMLSILFWVNVEQQEMVKEATANFVERVRYEGYISRDMYETYENKISVVPYKVLFYHQRYELNQNDQRVLTVYDQINILNTLYNTDPSIDKIYRLQKGDDFLVLLKPLQPSFFQYLLSFISQTSLKRETWISRGGMVFNESYK